MITAKFNEVIMINSHIRRIDYVGSNDTAIFDIAVNDVKRFETIQNLALNMDVYLTNSTFVKSTDDNLTIRW